MLYQEHHHGGEDGRARDARIFVENVEEMAANTRPGQPIPMLDRIDGTDRSGTVYCVVDARGTFVDLGIDPGWWGAVGPTRIASAIVDAVQYAKSKAMMARLILGRHGLNPEAGASDPGSFLTAEPSQPLPSPESDGFAAALEAKLERGFRILDAVERFNSQREVPERRVVTGPQGIFRLTVVGREIESAEIDQYGLGPSDHGRIAADARAALREVASTADSARPSSWEGR